MKIPQRTILALLLTSVHRSTSTPSWSSLGTGMCQFSLNAFVMLRIKAASLHPFELAPVSVYLRRKSSGLSFHSANVSPWSSPRRRLLRRKGPTLTAALFGGGRTKRGLLHFSELPLGFSAVYYPGKKKRILVRKHSSTFCHPHM